MKILRLYLRLPPEKGGMEHHIRRLTEEQLALGHQVRIGFNRGDKVSPEDLQVLRRIALLDLPFGVGVLLFHTFMLAKLLLRPAKYDVCHLHGDWHSLLFAPLYRLVSGARIAFSFHGAFEPLFFTHRQLLTRLLSWADLVFVNGIESFRQLKPHHQNIHLRSSGVEDIFFTVSPKDRHAEAGFKVMTIANLNPVKNLNTLVRIASRAPDFDFYLYGAGAQGKALEKQIHEQGISNLHLQGYRSRDELAVELGTADVFLLPSFKEGTPTVVLEAMAASVPVVASNAGGLSEFLDPGLACIVHDPLDVDRYLEALMVLRNNNEIRTQIIEKAHIFSQSLSWKSVAASITDCMKEIVSR